MTRIDLTPFGFTPTEGLVYEVLLTGGPGTGYAIARAANLARANAYAALEGLVSKGAARAEEGRPRRYRPEPPAMVLAQIASAHGRAIERLSVELDGLTAPPSPSLVEIASGRAALQLLSHDIARATRSVELLLPADAYPLLAPSLRRPVAGGLAVSLAAVGPVEFDVAPVRGVAAPAEWEGIPVVMVVDGRSAILATRLGSEVRGHWGTTSSLVSAARVVAHAGRPA